jgi:hypothetical protein
MRKAVAGGILALCLGIGLLGQGRGDTSAQGLVDLEHLVVLTEDWALHDIEGCDGLSIHNAATGEAYSRGKERTSPARIAVRRDLGLMVATASNGCANTNDGQPSIIGDCQPWLTVAAPRLPRGAMRSGVALGADFATMGGVTFDNEGRLIFASAKPKGGGPTAPNPGPPFHVARLLPPGSFRQRWVFPRPTDRWEVNGLPVEIFSRDDKGDIVAVTSNGFVEVIDAGTFSERHPPIPFASAVSARHVIWTLDK